MANAKKICKATLLISGLSCIFFGTIFAFLFTLFFLANNGDTAYTFLPQAVVYFVCGGALLGCFCCFACGPNSGENASTPRPQAPDPTTLAPSAVGWGPPNANPYPPTNPYAASASTAYPPTQGYGAYPGYGAPAPGSPYGAPPPNMYASPSSEPPPAYGYESPPTYEASAKSAGPASKA